LQGGRGETARSDGHICNPKSPGLSRERRRHANLLPVLPSAPLSASRCVRNHKATQSTRETAQCLRDNLLNLDDPPTTERPTLIQAFVRVAAVRLKSCTRKSDRPIAERARANA
jgi:hypothetical protein